jgi:hypothetical protein
MSQREEPNLSKDLASRPLVFEMLTRVMEADGPVTVTDLAKTTGRTLPTVYEAMRYLEKRSLVDSKKVGRERQYVKSGRIDLWDLVRSPALREQVSKSLYRFQREPTFAMADFSKLLAESLSKDDFEVRREATFETPLGSVRLDLVVSEQGKSYGIEVKRIGRVSEAREKFLSEIGLVTAMAKGEGKELAGIVLVILVPQGRLGQDFDEWKAISIARDAGTKTFKSEVVFEHVEDIDLVNRAFVNEVANRIREKLRPSP